MRSQRSIRAYLPVSLHKNAEIELDPRNIHHFHTVLRLKQNDQVIIFNGKEQLEAKATITLLNKKNGSLLINEVISVTSESPLHTCLWQAVSRSDRMDFAIQKSVELGVTQIQPVTTERSPFRLKGAKLEKKMKHWQGIIVSACEQSGRTILPMLHPPTLLDELLSNRSSTNLGILLDPQSSNCLQTIEAQGNTIDILIGPEGGFTTEELSAANAAGFIGYQLGPRILRTETAAICIITFLQTKFGDAG